MSEEQLRVHDHVRGSSPLDLARFSSRADHNNCNASRACRRRIIFLGGERRCHVGVEPRQLTRELHDIDDFWRNDHDDGAKWSL
jgi:hypothetical protein